MGPAVHTDDGSLEGLVIMVATLDTMQCMQFKSKFLNF